VYIILMRPLIFKYRAVEKMIKWIKQNMEENLHRTECRPQWKNRMKCLVWAEQKTYTSCTIIYLL